MERSDQFAGHGRVAFVNEGAGFSASHCRVVVNKQVLAFVEIYAHEPNRLSEHRDRPLTATGRCLAGDQRTAAERDREQQRNQ